MFKQEEKQKIINKSVLFWFNYELCTTTYTMHKQKKVIKITF